MKWLEPGKVVLALVLVATIFYLGFLFNGLQTLEDALNENREVIGQHAEVINELKDKLDEVIDVVNKIPPVLK